MPDDVLPAEHADYIARVAEVPGIVLPPAAEWDSLVQPSVDAVRTGLTAWANAAMRWAPDTPSWRTLAMLVARGVPVLQDPFGRVGIARSRVGAMAVSGLLAGPSLQWAGSPANAAFIDFCLELEARAHRVRTVAAIQQNDAPNTLPKAHDLFVANVPPSHGRPRRRTPSTDGALALSSAIERLCGFTDAKRLVPKLASAPPPEDPDDPLGLDAMMAEFIGGPVDLEAGAYDAAIQAAERLAMTAAATRVRFAGVATAIAETALDWSTGSPVVALDGAMRALDQDVVETLQLLVDVARASQSRQVSLKGLSNGLTRAAKGIERTRKRCTDQLVQVSAGVLPPDQLAGPPDLTPIDSLAEAFGIGEPQRAEAWAESLPEPLERQTCAVLVQAAITDDPEALLAPLETLVDAWRDRDPHLARALDVLRGACLLASHENTVAAEVGRGLMAVGVERRNGVLLAEGALLQMEALDALGDVAGRDAVHARAGAFAWRMGANGSLSLLARWTRGEAG